MLKVLIVDDEIPIREELRLLPWEENGFQLAGEAQNGKEAFALCQKLQPDIVITDIVMPLMDGLELTRRIKEWNPQIQIILLTLYREFHYAMDAIRLGAKEYLLKGAYSDEDLLRALKSARQAINKDKINSFYRAETENAERSLQLDRFLKSKGPAEAGRMAPELKLPARVISLEVEWDGAQSSLTERDIRQWIDSCDDLHILDMIFFSRREIQLFLSDKGLKPVSCDMEAFMDGFDREFAGCGLRCFIVIGNVAASPEEYRKMYFENRRILDKRFYCRESQIFFTTDARYRSLSPDETQAVQAKMKAHLQNSESMERFLQEEFIPFMKSRNIAPDEVKLMVAQWLADIKRSPVAESAGIGNADVVAAPDIYALIDRYIMVLKMVHFHGRVEGRVEIEKALQMIEQRLQEPWTIEDLSERVGLSPNYFGYLFKKILGENFKEYITKLRMEKASYLLKSTNLKIYEVAEKVGIPSYRYFSSVFQEYYGKSPREYKGGL